MLLNLHLQEQLTNEELLELEIMQEPDDKIKFSL